jgi:alkylmercury lyase
MSDKRTMSSFVSDVTLDEQVIRKVAFHSMLEGVAITRDGLVEATGFAREKVDTLVDGLNKRGLIVMDPDSDRILGSWGLSSLPTTHKLCIRGRTLHTWCALDAVGIPAALGEDAGIVSQCHHCGVPVKIEMVNGQVEHVEPPDVQLWITASEVGRSVVGFT